MGGHAALSLRRSAASRNEGEPSAALSALIFDVQHAGQQKRRAQAPLAVDIRVSRFVKYLHTLVG
jgi:hypothetical protein